MESDWLKFLESVLLDTAFRRVSGTMKPNYIQVSFYLIICVIRSIYPNMAKVGWIQSQASRLKL